MGLADTRKMNSSVKKTWIAPMLDENPDWIRFPMDSGSVGVKTVTSRMLMETVL